MNITLDKTNSTYANLKVSLKEADYAPKVEEKVKEYSRKAQIKGFRPGKVPAGLIRKMYGKSILVEQINELLHEAVNKYIKENDIRILGEPLPKQEDEAQIDWDNQKEFEFTYELGLLPDFTLPLESITVEGYEVEVDEDTVKEAYEHMQRQFGKTTNPETSEKGDFIYGELNAAAGEFNTKTLIPTNQIKAGEDKFMGVKAGDVIRFDIRETFGDDNAALAHVTGLSKDDAANLNGEFEFTVENINRTEPAAMDQEFFDKIFGKDEVTSQEAFDAKVRETIQENYDREISNAVNRNLIDKLVKETEIEIPEDFFKKWLLITNRGKLTQEQIEEHYEQYRNELKWSMIRNKVVEENELKVSNEEVKEQARQRILAQFNLPEISEELVETMNNFVDNYLSQNNGRNYINEYENILTEKVLAVLKEKVKIENKKVTAEEFRNQTFE